MNTHHLLRALLAPALFALGLMQAGAQSAAPQPAASVPVRALTEPYYPPTGAPFFLLTDSSFGSNDNARVRLEIAPADMHLLDETGGIDIAVYRVADPLAFLRQQKNLHRIELPATAKPEGLGNALSFLWDSAWKKGRTMWQGLFDAKLRGAVTEQAPQLKVHADTSKPPPYVHQPAFEAPRGMKAMQRFRYPVQHARPIQPPKDLALPGSSSEFVASPPGNIYIPLGQQRPGLHVVEASLGRHRALALLFVSDTVAVSKTSREQLLVWVAQRTGGKPAPGAQVMWSDLQGVLARGRTDTDGVAIFRRKVPETSYVFGADATGGVFVSENFYYDSEIYNNKLYAVTDRPLYRPGDEVHILLVGREFSGARSSKPMATSTVALTVLDAQGTPVFSDRVAYGASTGGSSRFTLPAQAPAGGYEIRMARGDDEYSAAFRVAQYVKPHFEILVEPDQPAWKTGEPVTGRIRLAYPDGKPVANAVVSLSARAQVLTMVDGDLAYGGAFPLQIDNAQELKTDAKGITRFQLPAAREPSRLVLTVLATDGAIQRVRATQQLLIERSASAYSLRPDRQFAMPKDAVQWRFAPVDAAAGGMPVQWIALHQGSRTRTRGSLGAGASAMQLQLERPGAYTIELRDAQDQLVAAAPFFVAGGELQPPQGAIEIVFDKPRYRPGETARALITFPTAVDDALLTLERDSVERWGRLGAASRVAILRKLNERQWEARIAVSAQFSPNITFSVAYVRGHDFGFQNAGIAVEQPALQVALKTDKAVYLPGDTVTVDIETLADGAGVAANVSLGAVDEMVYVLQPEIAPSIHEFFYHPRRNNVRTHSSLAFISYDEAAAPAGQEVPRSRSTQERGIKLLERPRRDERDTAFWQAHIQTDARGRARVTFTVPDALTRWRLTARGFAHGGKADGLVGEKRAWFLSDKPVYAKWTSPDWARAGDRATVSLAVFNQQKAAREVQVALQGAGAAQTRTVQLAPGANFVAFELQGLRQGGYLDAQIGQGGQVLDRLQTRFGVLPVEWPNAREALLPVPAGQSTIALTLPPDAAGLRLRALGEGAAAWSRVADALVDYPYGCVEQTASRLVPLALALRAMPAADHASSPLRQRLYGSRLRLAAMAGPNAVFGWWGPGTQHSALISSYAYYADFLSTQTLGMTLPPQHWEQLVQIYAKEHAHEPAAHRALALWMMREIGLPVTTYTRGLLEALAAEAAFVPQAPASRDSWILGEPGPRQAIGLVIAAQLARDEGLPWPAALNQPLAQARQVLVASPRLLPQAALTLTGASNAEAVQRAILQTVETDATIDRALALAWLAKSTGLRGTPAGLPLQAGADWQSMRTPTGAEQWLWRGAGAAPRSVSLAAAATQAFTLSVRYESHERSGVALPATVERRLFRLERREKGYEPVLVKAGEPLSTTALYLDQVTVRAQQPLRHAILEAALPPGAFLEPSTWGVTLLQGGKEEPLERALGEATRTGYTVPFDALQGGKTVRHLVRFAQRGEFALPAARLWRMYQPEAQAYEAGAAAQGWVVR